MKHITFPKIYLQEGQTKHMMQLVHSWTDIFRHKIIKHEPYVFQNVRQSVDENIHQFYMLVKEQAAKCDFRATLDTEIKQ